MDNLPTQSELQLLFSYRDGKLFWNKTVSNKKAGSRAGKLNKQRGYRYVGYRGRHYLEHRVIYKLVHGHCPRYLDHVNRNRSDNRIENLRQTTHSANHYNKQKVANKTSEEKGVCFDKRTGKWMAYLTVSRCNIHLGYYQHEKEAIKVRRQVYKEWTGEENEPSQTV